MYSIFFVSKCEIRTYSLPLCFFTILTAYIISASRVFVQSLKFHRAFTPEGGRDASRALHINSRVLPQSLSFCRRSGVGSFWRLGSPSTGTSRSSMAELPAPPAPVGLAEIAEEPAAAAVPVGAEMEPPPVIEDEVFFSRIIFWSCLFFAFLLHVFGIPSLLFYVWPLTSPGFLPMPAIFGVVTLLASIPFSACLYSFVVR